MRRPLYVLIASLAPLVAGAQALYLCEDPRTGRKIAQDSPCKTGKLLRSYELPSLEEQKAREAASRQAKREFERLHPGTYAPEEYMTEEELAAWRAEQGRREALRRKQEEAAAIQEAQRRAQEAERRAREAERTAEEARAKASAAEAAASRTERPLLIVPTPALVPAPPYQPRLPTAPRPAPFLQPRCEREDCQEAPPRREGREAPPATGRRPL
ncbi:MAG: hypothetical protein N3C63_02475 [Rhodocyclaceae bacterium]|nr:hypothetical protein [Rhodocyclaceae bacterium]